MEAATAETPLLRRFFEHFRSPDARLPEVNHAVPLYPEAKPPPLRNAPELTIFKNIGAEPGEVNNKNLEAAPNWLGILRDGGRIVIYESGKDRKPLASIPKEEFADTLIPELGVDRHANRRKLFVIEELDADLDTISAAITATSRRSEIALSGDGHAVEKTREELLDYIEEFRGTSAEGTEALLLYDLLPPKDRRGALTRFIRLLDREERLRRAGQSRVTPMNPVQESD